MKFVVTGGAGFIGSHLSKFLLKKNHQVVIIDNLERGSLDNIAEIEKKVEFHKIDISNYAELNSVIDSPDGIFHQAGLNSIPTSFREPEKYHKINVIGTENIFKIGQKYNSKIIFASSSSVYGDQVNFPINENAEKNPKNPYGQTKLDDEIIASKYAKNGLQVIGLRYFNVFGIGQNPEYAGVIPRFIEKLSQKQPPMIEGDGNQVRNFTYIDDVVRANWMAFESNVNHSFINIAAGLTTSINELANMMIKISGLDLKPVYGEPRKGDIKKSQADNSLAKELIGWSPQISLEEGIGKIFSKV
jgi:UDP-glucose 4-epimerase